MEDDDVKPDAMTYSYLIANCQREKDIAKVVMHLISRFDWGRLNKFRMIALIF